MWNLMMQNFVENVKKQATTSFLPLSFIGRGPQKFIFKAIHLHSKLGELLHDAIYI